jgi:hypothetical protein
MRLCNSLLEARYYDVKVPIYFHIDGDPLPEVVRYVQDLVWPFGRKHITISDMRRGMPSVRLITSNFVLNYLGDRRELATDW